jgi:hypothetical protein
MLRRVVSFGFICVAFHFCAGQTRDVVCDAGYGSFETTFDTGVSVVVAAPQSGGFAERSCNASLFWDGQQLRVAEEAAQVDIDVLGADLGFGAAVVAFQIKRAAADSDMTYQIYSLQKTPKLLRTIAGGDFFRAADTDLRGRIEIWTGDVQAISGFEGLDASEFDFAPTVVLQFERNRLIDVSAEFQSHFDEQIANVRDELSAQRLQDFRRSDGRLLPGSALTLDQMRSLRTTKIKVLEIAWSYLYSGREQEAWRALTDLWPPADFDRIRRAILNARNRGIRSQVEGVSTKAPRTHSMKHAYVFDAITEPPQANVGHFPFVDIRPRAILLRRPPPLGTQLPLPHSEQMLELVIDAAGKVWSAEPVGDVDKQLVYAAKGWKFIPAFTGGRAVASRIRLSLSNYR